MRFNVICCDPPWSFDDRLQKMKSQTKRSAREQYQTLSFSEILDLDVKSLVDPNGCLLALWTPSTLLSQGLAVMQRWGFSFKQTYVWVKVKKSAAKETDMNKMTSVGMGRLFRQSHEIALIGTSGKVYSMLENRGQRSVVFDLNRGHSTKPEGLQDSLDLMFPKASKVELFARRCRPTWATVGDAVTGKDIKESIQDLIKL